MTSPLRIHPCQWQPSILSTDGLSVSVSMVSPVRQAGGGEGHLTTSALLAASLFATWSAVITVPLGGVLPGPAQDTGLE